MRTHDPDNVVDQLALHQTPSHHSGNTVDQLSPQSASVDVGQETQQPDKPASPLSSPQSGSVNVEMKTHHLDNAADQTSLAQTTSVNIEKETHSSYNAADQMSLPQSALIISEIKTQHPNEPAGQVFLPRSLSIDVVMETQNLHNAADQTSLPQSSSTNDEKATDLSDNASDQMFPLQSRTIDTEIATHHSNNEADQIFLPQRASIDFEMATDHYNDEMSLPQRASTDFKMTTDHSNDTTYQKSQDQTIMTGARVPPDSIQHSSNTPAASAAIDDSIETVMTTSEALCVVCKATLVPGVTWSMCAHPECVQTSGVPPFWVSRTKSDKWWPPMGSSSVNGHLSRPHVFIHAPNLEWPEPTAADLAPKLLTIPLEIRQKIFAFLLIANGPIKIPGNAYMKFPSLHYQPEEIDVQEETVDGSIQYWQATQPFLICRQLYHELMPIFFSLNTFEFSTALALRILEDFLRGMGSERRKYVGGVHLVDESVVATIEIRYWNRFCARTPSAKVIKDAYRLLGESRRLKFLSISVPGFEYLDDKPVSDEDKALHPRIRALHVDHNGDDEQLEWRYVKRVRDLWKELNGIHQLKGLRGLKEVRLVDHNTKQSLMDSETFGPFGEEFKEALTTPKILVGNERVEEVPAMRLVKDIKARQKEEKEKEQLKKANVGVAKKKQKEMLKTELRETRTRLGTKRKAAVEAEEKETCSKRAKGC